MISEVRPEHRIQSFRGRRGYRSDSPPNWQALEVVTQHPFDTSSLSVNVRAQRAARVLRLSDPSGLLKRSLLIAEIDVSARETACKTLQIRPELRPGNAFSESRHRRSSRALSAN